MLLALKEEIMQNNEVQSRASVNRAKMSHYITSRPELLSLCGFIILCIVMTLVSDNFLTMDNLTNIARQVSINAIIASGLTLVILTGGIDLSVGAVMALSGTFVAGAMIYGMSPIVSVMIGLAIGICAGFINGFLVAYLHMPSFIVTLAMMEVPRGIALLYTGGYPLSGLPKSFAILGRGSIFGLQTPILVMIIVYIAVYIVLNHLPFGRYVYAIGGNEEAVRLSGIKVPRYKMLVYAISGLTASISGVVLSSRLMSGQPNSGVGFELDAIAAVILGGTDIAGGKGHIVGTLIGALILGVLNNGLNLLGVSPYSQKVLKGAIIILAIYISSSRQKKQG